MTVNFQTAKHDNTGREKKRGGFQNVLFLRRYKHQKHQVFILRNKTIKTTSQRLILFRKENKK